MQMLERELKREKTMESAAREKRIKATQKRPNSAIRPMGQALDDLLTAAEQDFYNAIYDGDGAVKEAAIARAREYEDSRKVLPGSPAPVAP
jgi:dynein intermediate chain 2, axonemal